MPLLDSFSRTYLTSAVFCSRVLKAVDGLTREEYPREDFESAPLGQHRVGH